MPSPAEFALWEDYQVRPFLIPFMALFIDVAFSYVDNFVSLVLGGR